MQHCAHPHTSIRRPLLFNQAASSRSQSCRKEFACWNRTGRQHELYCPLYASIRGHPMDYARPRNGRSCGAQEAWGGKVIWPKQIGKVAHFPCRWLAFLNLRKRAIFCSRMNSLDDMETMGLCPFPCSQAPSMQISRATQARFGSVSGGCLERVSVSYYQVEI
jgi:hypothetical protein